MAYTTDLGDGQKLWLSNHGAFTQITLGNSASEPQQRQSNSFETGAWIAPPALFCTAIGVVLRIHAALGQTFIQIQESQMQLVSTLLQPLQDADAVPLQEVGDDLSAQPMSQIQSLSSLPPLQIGDMQMQTTDGIVIQLPSPFADSQQTPSSTVSAAESHRFCSQCGHSIGRGDRFCSHCGHKLGN
jgi:zinc-ribbon domain